MNMKMLSATVAAVGLIALPAATFAAQQTETMPAPTVEVPAADASASAPVAASGTIVDVAKGSADFKTLATAIDAANLGDTLNGAGPFTVFAPADYAFAKLPAGTVDTLVKPDNQTMLQGVLTYHVIAGTVRAADLITQIDAAGGTLALKTVNGANLTAKREGQGVALVDAKGNVANITAVDMAGSNGVIHAIDAVLMP